MPDDVTPMLARLRADHDLELAAVAFNGEVVAADAAGGIDVAQICSTVTDVMLLGAALGAEMDLGSMRMTSIEYERGTVVMTPLATGEDLVLLTTDPSNLGQIRIAARRFQSAYTRASATP
ncbi:MAG: roadblock/LC7 domain-containing protein [Thermomicrobiales bacterium]